MTTTPVWISLGSNLGDRRAILDAAVLALSQTEGVVVTRVSTYRETIPVGGPPGQGPFLNAAARLDTTLDPRTLLAQTQRIEAELGRVRAVRWGERTLDIDLLIFGSKFVDEPDLKLPHPRLAVRRFVLEPLAEIAPDVVDTITRRTVADLLANLDRRPRIVMVDDSDRAWGDTFADQLAASLGGACLTRPTYQSTFEPERRLARLNALLSGLAQARSHSIGWIVCNFLEDVPRDREIHGRPPHEITPKVFADRVAAAFKAGGEVFQARIEREARKITLARMIAHCLATAPDPTIIVPVAGSRLHRRAGVARTPIYRPEATEPDAIVAEVVAVCRGIAGPGAD